LKEKRKKEIEQTKLIFVYQCARKRLIVSNRKKGVALADADL